MEMHNNQIIMSTIIRDISDGAIVIDNSGTIVYLNSAGMEILQKDTDTWLDKKYTDFFEFDEDNEDFHQFILDAIYDKDNIHCGIVTYVTGKDKKKLRITSSFIFNENKTERIGISLIFSDVTEVDRLNTVRRESTIIFAILMSFVTLYIFAYTAIYTIIPDFNRSIVMIIAEVMAIIATIVILKKTSISVRDFNLRMKNPLRRMIPAIIIAISTILFMMLVKIIILAFDVPFFPEDSPFFSFTGITIWHILYPLTAFIQEILARCIMQTSLKHVFTGKYAGFLAIIVSSLIFGALHIAHGLSYMIGSFLLLGVMGIYYEKSNRNIWGTFLLHYVLGTVAEILMFVT